MLVIIIYLGLNKTRIFHSESSEKQWWNQLVAAVMPSYYLFSMGQYDNLVLQGWNASTRKSDVDIRRFLFYILDVALNNSKHYLYFLWLYSHYGELHLN